MARQKKCTYIWQTKKNARIIHVSTMQKMKKSKKE